MREQSTGPWSVSELALIGAAAELQIAAQRPDGTLRRETPIWVVCVDGEVYVRTWHRRDTGWFGAALASGRARVRVPGLEAEVGVEDVGDADTDLSAGVDAAYRAKYRGGAESMVTAAATASTLRLSARRRPSR